MSVTIAHHPADQAAASQLSDALAQSSIDPYKPVLLALLSSESAIDATVADEVCRAAQAGATIVPVTLDSSDVPDSWNVSTTPFAWQPDDSIKPLIAHVRRLEIGEKRVKSNNRYLLAAGALIFTIFAIAIVTLASGTVGFPVNEYATEDAAIQQQQQLIILPTLDAFMPRTTEDAQAFQTTARAMPTRLRNFFIATGTALPANAIGTQQGIRTAEAEVTLQAGSTMTATVAPGAGDEDTNENVASDASDG